MIADCLARNVVDLFGTAGEAWIRALPELLAEVARQWSLALLPAFPDLSYNYVAPARMADGREAVLKVGFPTDEVRREIEALRVFDGHGCARLLAADAGRGWLLLEQVLPGTPLTTLAADDDAAATTHAVAVMRRLWRRPPPDHPFPTMSDWIAGLERLRARFGGGTGPLPPHLVQMAERFFADLCAANEPPLLLHGDLHHQNILAATRAPWLAIDPKGVVGHPGFEIGPLLFNPPGIHRHPELGRLLHRRMSIVAAELGFDRERVAGWALARALLSAWWSIEDHGDGWQPAVTIAEHLARFATA